MDGPKSDVTAGSDRRVLLPSGDGDVLAPLEGRVTADRGR